MARRADRQGRGGAAPPDPPAVQAGRDPLDRDSVAVNLEQWIDALKRMDIASLEVRVTECVALENVIVATVDAQWKVRYLGQLIDERVLLTDVWVQRGRRLAGGPAALQPGPARREIE